nr:hypothetical protein GCM10025730_02310 [Promicromonospora thailandica]
MHAAVPGPARVRPGLRFTAAFVSAVVVSLAYAAVTAVLLTVARRRVLAGVWALGGLAILGALAVQLVRWGGLAG